MGNILKYHNMYMDIAKISANMSHCSRKKVGCVIVNGGRIISQGWNGTPPGHENSCEDPEGNTNPYVVHSESNAISFAAKNGISINGSSLYITMSPCFDCSKLIIQSGIKEVIFDEKYRNTDPIHFLKKSGIKVWHLKNGQLNEI